MAQMKFFRETSVPVAPYAKSACYFIKAAGSSEVDIYFTNNDGTELSNAISYGQVDQKIADALSGFSSMRVATDIAARDALTSSFTSNVLVFVTDATSDNLVDAGAAMYFWDNVAQSFEKVYEMEGLDFVINWDGIVGRPSSTPVQIDDAVSKAHAHANMAQLDKITETVDGFLQYDGDVILDGQVVLNSNAW